MVTERAVETQRDALLRLLAGWLAIVEFVSSGPFALLLPQWARAFFNTVLIRAELAAHYLLVASASMQAKRRGGALRYIAQDGMSEFKGRKYGLDCEGGVPSTEDLHRRMIVLRMLLKNLHREARRLMQDPSSSRAAGTRKSDRTTRRTPERTRIRSASDAKRMWTGPHIDRPPDKISRAC